MKRMLVVVSTTVALLFMMGTANAQQGAAWPPGDYSGPVNVTVASVTGPTQNFTVSAGARLQTRWVIHPFTRRSWSAACGSVQTRRAQAVTG
jgi:hypothetical protein